MFEGSVACSGLPWPGRHGQAEKVTDLSIPPGQEEGRGSKPLVTEFTSISMPSPEGEGDLPWANAQYGASSPSVPCTA